MDAKTLMRDLSKAGLGDVTDAITDDTETAIRLVSLLTRAVWAYYSATADASLNKDIRSMSGLGDCQYILPVDTGRKTWVAIAVFHGLYLLRNTTECSYATAHKLPLAPEDKPIIRTSITQALKAGGCL